MVACLGLLVWGTHFAFWRAQLKRFQALREGVLYRVAQPSEFGFDTLVKRQHVKTVLSLQLSDHRLHQDWLDPGKANGSMESEYVRQLGIQHLQWPMGEEANWPWLTPWQFEEFFKLLDDPENHPIVVHCMGGRHRTGTFSSMFRLEYDRWPVEKALNEMYSFDFGHPLPVQEHNLRTYLPRPHPDASEWQSLRDSLLTHLHPQSAVDFEHLVRSLRRDRSATSESALHEYFTQDRPFALALAYRMIDTPQDARRRAGVGTGAKTLDRPSAPSHAWSMAAALIADYGTPEDQQTLLKLIEREVKQPEVTPHYAAIVAGVTNRYTPNRLPYLRPMIDDERHRPEPAAAKYRYCETAVSRLASITDQEFFVCIPDRKIWNDSRIAAKYWFDHHVDASRLTTLLPPTGKNPVRVGDGPIEEDLSRMRR